jgi:hypothetical protein
MNRRLLMVSTASRWLGTARMPRSLAKAGFRVALLAPRDSIALRSRYVERKDLVRDEATPMQWLVALVSMIHDVNPALVVPCDEVAIRLLFELVRRPPPQLAGDARRGVEGPHAGACRRMTGPLRPEPSRAIGTSRTSASIRSGWRQRSA